MIRKISFLTLIIFLLSSFTYSYLYYDANYVSIETLGDKYEMVYMQREASQGKINAKYFAAKDTENNMSVPERYASWKKGKSVICATSGTYMDSYDYDAKPEGLTVDNGKIVNKIVEEYDALVIVYATGGVVVSNLEDADLRVKGSGLDNRTLDVRGNTWDKHDFLNWAEDKGATVFQTHLLVYKDELQISSKTTNSYLNKRERRMLAVGYDENNELVHMIINIPGEYGAWLYNATKDILDILKNRYYFNEVTYMVNLDTGAQDVFNVYDSSGKFNNYLQGQTPLNEAVNLLVYYYD